jgi:hypothetical protein
MRPPTEIEIKEPEISDDHGPRMPPNEIKEPKISDDHGPRMPPNEENTMILDGPHTKLASEIEGSEALYLPTRCKTPEEIDRVLSSLDNRPPPTEPTLDRLLEQLSSDIDTLKSKGYALGMIQFCVFFYKNSLTGIMSHKANHKQRSWTCDRLNAILDDKIEASLKSRPTN